MGDYSVAAHDHAATHHYVMHYLRHPSGGEDPHYRDFGEYRRRTHAGAAAAGGEASKRVRGLIS